MLRNVFIFVFSYEKKKKERGGCIQVIPPFLIVSLAFSAGRAPLLRDTGALDLKSRSLSKIRSDWKPSFSIGPSIVTFRQFTRAFLLLRHLFLKRAEWVGSVGLCADYCEKYLVAHCRSWRRAHDSFWISSCCDLLSPLSPPLSSSGRTVSHERLPGKRIKALGGSPTSIQYIYTSIYPYVFIYISWYKVDEFSVSLLKDSETWPRWGPIGSSSPLHPPRLRIHFSCFLSPTKSSYRSGYPFKWGWSIVRLLSEKMLLQQLLRCFRIISIPTTTTPWQQHRWQDPFPPRSLSSRVWVSVGDEGARSIVWQSKKKTPPGIIGAHDADHW